jgi:hypothetical protein
MIEDTLGRKRIGDEDQEWLNQKSRRWEEEDLYHGEPDDMY